MPAVSASPRNGIALAPDDAEALALDPSEQCICFTSDALGIYAEKCMDAGFRLGWQSSLVVIAMAFGLGVIAGNLLGGAS